MQGILLEAQGQGDGECCYGWLDAVLFKQAIPIRHCGRAGTKCRVLYNRRADGWCGIAWLVQKLSSE